MGLVLAAVGCRQLNASHCGNQQGDLTCEQRDPNAPYCNVCEAFNDGCLPERATEPGCGFGQASTGGVGSTATTTTADESSTGAVLSTGAVDSSSTGEPNLCGNGVIDEGEVCDGDVLPEDPPNCSTQGYGVGLPACHEDCTRLNYMMCPGYVEECGNQEVGAEEECDGTVFGGGMQSCDDFPNFTGDGLTCNDDCSFNTTGCMMCREHGQSCSTGDTCCNPNDTCAAVSKLCCVPALGLCTN